MLLRHPNLSPRRWWTRVPLRSLFALCALTTVWQTPTSAQQPFDQPQQTQTTQQPTQQLGQQPRASQLQQNQQQSLEQQDQQPDRPQQQQLGQQAKTQRSQNIPERQTSKLPEDRADQDAPAIGVITGPCPGRAVCVKATLPHSPADEAGIEPGDYILSVDGQEVTSPAALRKVLTESKTDKEVTLRVWRQGEEMDRKVHLASMSDKLPKGHDAWLGVLLAAAEEGVKIDHIVPGSPAEESELEEGDVIKKVKGESITEASVFIGQIESMGPEEELQLVVERDGEEHEVNVMLGSMNDAPIAFLRQLQSSQNPALLDGPQGNESAEQLIDRALDDMRRQIRELRKEVRELKGDSPREQAKPVEEKKGDASTVDAKSRGRLVSQIQLRVGPQGNYSRPRYYGNNGGYRPYNYYQGRSSYYYGDGYRSYRPNYSNNNYYYRYGGRPYYYNGNGSWYGYRPQPGIQIAPNLGVYWY